MACKDKERDARIIANLAKRKKQQTQTQQIPEIIEIDWEGDLQLFDVFVEDESNILKIEKTNKGWIATCTLP